MRRSILAIATTIAGLVLLLSFKTHGTSALPAAAATTATAAQTTTARTTTVASTPAATASTTKTVTGGASQTRYGPVQVQLTVKNGTITGVTAVQSPGYDPRSQQINAYAIPVLNQEALAARSANISMVSGATYTSDGYLASLQSALGKAGLA